jgi:hypothetical protein
LPGKRWQYQIKADVASTQPEASRVDKWIGQRPDYIFRKPALIAAIVAGSFFFGMPPASEAVKLDKWAGRRPEIITVAKPGLSRAIQAGACFLGDVPRAQTVYIAALTTIESGSLVRRPARPQALLPASSFIWNPLTVEVVTIDKWMGQRTEIFRGPSAFTRAMRSIPVVTDIFIEANIIYINVSDSGLGTDTIVVYQERDVKKCIAKFKATKATITVIPKLKK